MSAVSLINAEAADIPVYKGELRVQIHTQHARDTLLLQYRTKTSEVVRLGVTGLTMINTATKQAIRLEDRSTGPAGRVEEGYLITDIVYPGLSLGGDEYRIDGSLVVYLAGSQQSRNFSIYLQPESSRKPPASGIDWSR